ncbi:MAG: GWxTD domain-containing protein [bacterium]|nr:GWxTD domain-containing protein [bacterium]
MRKFTILAILLLCAAPRLHAQPELYSDYFIGLPEYRILPLRLPTENPDSVKIEIHLRIVNDDLQFVKKDDHYEAGYGVDFSLRDDDDNPMGTVHVDRALSAESFAKTNSRQSGDQTEASFVVAPTVYQLRVRLTDRESRKTRDLDQEISFAKKDWSTVLRLSDIQLIDSTGTTVMTSGLIKDNRIAAVFAVYSKNPKDVNLSYSLYNDTGQSLVKAAIPWKGDGAFMTDTIYFSTDTLSNVTYPLIVTASIGELKEVRSYPIKILWKNLPVYIQDLDLAIRQLRYVAKPEEIERMNAPPEKKAELFKQFWAERNPNPTSQINERMEEYYRRVDYANQHFSGHNTGWDTDMGRVYIIYGQPSDVERHPFDTNTKPYEIWYYYDLNRKFLFADEEGFGIYRLKSPFWDDF